MPTLLDIKSPFAGQTEISVDDLIAAYHQSDYDAYDGVEGAADTCDAYMAIIADLQRIGAQSSRTLVRHDCYRDWLRDTVDVTPKVVVDWDATVRKHCEYLRSIHIAGLGTYLIVE